MKCKVPDQERRSRGSAAVRKAILSGLAIVFGIF
jgi:hypothetical protein